MNHADEILSILREEIEQYDNRTRRAETGSVLEIGDGIATVYGLDRAVYGELIEFETGAQGMVLNLERDSVGVVLLGSEAGLHEGSWAKRTGRAADVPVGDAMLGRTVNALGQRLSEVGRLGFTKCLVAARTGSKLDAPDGLQLIRVRNIREALAALL